MTELPIAVGSPGTAAMPTMDETICTGGNFADDTGGGLSRIRVNTVTSTATTPKTPAQ